MSKKKTHAAFLSEVTIKNPDVEVLGSYVSYKDRVRVRCCICGHVWSPTADSLIHRHGCPVCSGSAQITKEEFIRKLAAIRNDVILAGDYEKATKKTAFRFLNCGHIYEMTPSKVLIGRGCPVCSRARRGASQRFTLKDFEQAMIKVDPNLRLAEGAEYKNELTPVKVRCNACGHEFEIGLKALKRSGGCPFCHRSQTSYMEQFIYHTFIKVFGQEEVLSRDKETIGMELDILVPSRGIAVEPGSWYYHADHVDRDKEKKEACARKGIRLITVYDHYDENNAPFEDCLVYPFDLSARKHRKMVKETVTTLLAQFGIEASFSPADWSAIEKAAWKDSRRMTTEQFKAELAGLNPDIEFIDEYTFANDRKQFRCKKDGYTWLAQPTSIRMGTGCPMCAGTIKKTEEAFLQELAEKNPGITPLDPFVGTGTAIRFKCDACGHVWKTQPYHLTSKNDRIRTGCPRCNGSVMWTHEEFVAAISRISPRIRVLGDFNGRHQRVKVECLDCHRVWSPFAGDLLAGKRCRACSWKKIGQAHAKAVLCLTTGEVFPSIRVAAAKYGVSPSAIVLCLKGKSKNAAGKKWEYYAP